MNAEQFALVLGQLGAELRVQARTHPAGSQARRLFSGLHEAVEATAQNLMEGPLRARVDASAGETFTLQALEIDDV